MRAVTRVVVVLLGLGSLAGCGENHPAAADREPSAPRTADHAAGVTGVTREQSRATLEIVTTAPQDLAFRGGFAIDDGVWYLGRTYPTTRFATGQPEQANGLVDARERGGLWIFAPGMYGRFRVQVQGYAARPPVPASCEDAVEVSYRHGGGRLVLGSFETSRLVGRLAAGTYRVRLCASGLDRAARETDVLGEFDGDDYRTYSSRHFFQLWPAPMTADAVLRTGSRFARQANANFS